MRTPTVSYEVKKAVNEDFVPAKEELTKLKAMRAKMFQL